MRNELVETQDVPVAHAAGRRGAASGALTGDVPDDSSARAGKQNDVPTPSRDPASVSRLPRLEAYPASPVAAARALTRSMRREIAGAPRLARNDAAFADMVSRGRGEFCHMLTHLVRPRPKT